MSLRNALEVSEEEIRQFKMEKQRAAVIKELQRFFAEPNRKISEVITVLKEAREAGFELLMSDILPVTSMFTERQKERGKGLRSTRSEQEACREYIVSRLQLKPSTLPGLAKNSEWKYSQVMLQMEKLVAAGVAIRTKEIDPDHKGRGTPPVLYRLAKKYVP